MTKGLIITLGILGSFVLVLALFGFGYLGFTNDANQAELGIKAQYEENQNVYDNGWKKIQEVAQVPTQQVAAMKDVYMSAIQGRFGANGSQAMFQAFKEAEINIDQSTFKKVQQVIEEFRNKFEQRQTEMISRKQSYLTMLQATTSGRIYNTIGGYPRIDLDKYAKIITSDQTDTTFREKKADSLDVFGNKKKP